MQRLPDLGLRCGPCKKIAPIFQSLADSVTEAVFYKVDVDASPETAKKFSVAAMPTFIALKNGVAVDQMKGADEAKLREFVAKNK